MRTVLGVLGISGLSSGLQWGRFPMPTQLGLTELMHRVETAAMAGSSSSAATTTGTTTGGVADDIKTLIDSVQKKTQDTQKLVDAHLLELDKANGEIGKAVTQAQTNEHNRIGLVKEYNQGVITLNQLLVEMTTGSQQINDVISTANRVKRNLAKDIQIINDAITVTNDWMVKMDNWVTFVKAETSEIDDAQANLVKWGDSTKTNINVHEIAAIKLAREAYDLETEITDMSNFLLSTGKMLGYSPQTLTMAEAAGGLGWSYTYWS